MTEWTTGELAKIGSTDELQIASMRRDGTLMSPRTIWVVRHGDDVYVRSVNGRSAAWYRGTRQRHEGHIRAGDVDKDVTFVDTPDDINDQVDAEYHAKYGRYPANFVQAITSPAAASTTMRLVPR